MHDSLLVRRGDGIGHVGADPRDEPFRQRGPRVDPLGELLSFEQLHGHEDEPLVLTEVEDFHDAGVPNGCGGLGFLEEARDGAFTLGGVG